MKVFKMNDTETIIASTEKEAVDYYKRTFGVIITEDYTEAEFNEEFGISVKELAPSEYKMHLGDITKDELITAKEFIERFPNELPVIFSSEI